MDIACLLSDRASDRRHCKLNYCCFSTLNIKQKLFFTAEDKEERESRRSSYTTYKVGKSIGMDPAEVTSGVHEEFRYLLVRIGPHLNRSDCEGLMFVHKIRNDEDKADKGLDILSKMEAKGHFDPLHPERLQEVLSKIGRRDFAHDIKEVLQP